MKILEIKFKNINSLIGENRIDFTEPIFTNDGIFAITGKTGAGKSSILDAICLALYGKTPRVDITGNENAVMTRGEKDCYAEILFEVAGKKWKSSWKQERTRTGSLKAVARTIADENDQIVADKISIKGDKKSADEKTVDEKIAEIIGLTFKQFTKVVMLAQGGFTAFLQAEENEKGQLLEQITGTEIYAEISKKVFEKNKAEKEKLEKISYEIQAIKVLSEQETQKIREEITLLKNEKKQIDEDLKNIEIAQKWLTDLKMLKEDVEEIEQKMPLLQEQTKKKEQSRQEAHTFWLKITNEQKSKEGIFEKVRELDTRISEKEATLQPILQNVSKLEKKQTDLNAILEKQKNDLRIYQEKLSEKKNWAQKNEKYKELISTYTAIEKQNANTQKLIEEIKKIQEEISILQKDIENKREYSHQAELNLKEKQKNLISKTEILQKQEQDLRALLGDKELAEHQKEKEHINHSLKIAKQIIELEYNISKLKSDIQVLAEEIKTNEKNIEALQNQILINKENDKNLKERIRLLEENIQLKKAIESYEEARRKLQDQQPCPLCGSLEHPFAKENTPKIGQEKQELALLKEQYEELQNILIENEKSLTKFSANKENAIKNKEKQTTALLESTEKKNSLLAEIQAVQKNFASQQEEINLKIEKFVQEKQKELNKITELIEKAFQNQKQIAALRDTEIPTLEKQQKQAQEQKNKAEVALQLAENTLQNKQNTFADLQKKYEIEHQEITATLSKYDAENVAELKKHLENWEKNTQEIETLNSQITLYYTDINANQQALKHVMEDLERTKNQKDEISSQIKQLQIQREKIFPAQKSLEEEEKKIRELVENAEMAKKKNEEEKNEALINLERNQAILQEKLKDLQKLQDQHITEKKPEELKKEFEIKKMQADEYSQKIGAYTQQLETNAHNLKISGDKLKEKEKQEAICSKWSKLDKLIGQNDGKKYRNFAQALTFEHLIELANRHLRKMSDRYLLKRATDSSNQFNLSVIDKFQNNQERTAQNLSGGEKFIVSLSLALGLANMASRNMRIDTMFIDEGFGTLDNDYLDIALSALANLQNEGKMIGIISHIAELKERIATHIEVIENKQGFSSIRIV
ncbi:MAG: AAA family ATPase [Raineya sp.]